MIDALPAVEEVMAMDLAGLLAVQQQIFTIRDMIVESTGEFTEAEDFSRFDVELGEARIEKFNSLFIYADEYIRNDSAALLSRSSAAATAINMGTGRIVVNANGVTQYTGGTTTVNFNFPYNSYGYRLYGSSIINAANSRVLVTPGVTVTLYFSENLTISNNNHDCVTVTGADVTIVLLDGTTTTLTCGFGSHKDGAGALAKNDALDGRRLTIRCQSSTTAGHVCVEGAGSNSCGKLIARGTVIQAMAIGSTFSTGGITSNKGGFANLYIEGGIIDAKSGNHAAAIGTVGGTAYMNEAKEDETNPQMLLGQYCKNINISGGRVYAYGGEGCAGIGSGWAGPVDGVHISGSAYVYAQGGQNSPGIGSGGVTSSNHKVSPDSLSLSVKNILISGGSAVVEAEGSLLANGTHNDVPGIGSGEDNHGRVGTVTNVQAQPYEGWLAIVKQGASELNSSGVPSANDIDITDGMYYKLVYFKNLDKTAIVYGPEVDKEEEDTGAADEMVETSVGDTVKYIIRTKSTDIPEITYTVTDTIPAGMSLVETPGSYTAGMDWNLSPISGLVTVQWDGQTGSKEFFFTVKVDSLEDRNSRGFINQAYLSAANLITLYSNYTYHYTHETIITPHVEIRVRSFIGNKVIQNQDTQEELAARPFFVTLSGGARGSVALKHSENSGIMIVHPDDKGAVVKVSVIASTEFEASISAFIVHNDGTAEVQTGESITIFPGDDIKITVTSEYNPKPFFKAWQWLSNKFANLIRWPL
jgi:hypothetical protein